jgi:hypothetical protein
LNRIEWLDGWKKKSMSSRSELSLLLGLFRVMLMLLKPGFLALSLPHFVVKGEVPLIIILPQNSIHFPISFETE